jgi:threonine 3-dehydrogenase
MTEIPMNEVVFRYLHLKGINGRKMWSTWDKMHVLLEQGSIDVDRILTHRMPVSEFEQGIALALSGECGKVVLDFD